jgi:hypothetical protein
MARAIFCGDSHAMLTASSRQGTHQGIGSIAWVLCGTPSRAQASVSVLCAHDGNTCAADVIRQSMHVARCQTCKCIKPHGLVAGHNFQGPFVSLDRRTAQWRAGSFPCTTQCSKSARLARWCLLRRETVGRACLTLRMKASPATRLRCGSCQQHLCVRAHSWSGKRAQERCMKRLLCAVAQPKRLLVPW